jgi:hypothetical protein
MTRIAVGIVAALALAAGFSAAPAQAQSGSLTRSFVSSTGVDTNPCTITQPCASFAHAYTMIGANGIVAALDPGKYGPLTIVGPVTINGNGWAAITGPSGGTAIAINAPGATVKLRGLTLDGANLGDFGINFGAGSRIEILDCVISDFKSAGISIGQTGAISVLISNTIVLDTDVPADASAGIVLSLDGSGGSITAALDHVTISNDNSALVAQAFGGSVETLVTDSHIDNNSVGIYLFGNTNSTSSMILKNVTLNQDTTGISLNGVSSVWMSQVTQTSVPGFVNTAVEITSGSTIAYSDGTNHLMGAVTGGSTTSWATQ